MEYALKCISVAHTVPPWSPREPAFTCLFAWAFPKPVVLKCNHMKFSLVLSVWGPRSKGSSPRPRCLGFRTSHVGFRA